MSEGTNPISQVPCLKSPDHMQSDDRRRERPLREYGEQRFRRAADQLDNCEETSTQINSSVGLNIRVITLRVWAGIIGLG
jgi:hypothetical protein